jgi:septal ring factor EnvC (AmiA/AmiB activator)
MNEDELAEALNELTSEAKGESTPEHEKLRTLAKRAQQNRKKLEKSLNELQESLDLLRVCIKYQVFDLEATRRENAYLKKLLEEKPGEDA